VFPNGTVIDGHYEVVGVCSNGGGMGTLFHIRDSRAPEIDKVLKACKLTDPEMLGRFRREVRVMQQFKGNGYVMPILDANLDHAPPYFVMPFCKEGDLMARAPEFRSDMQRVESVFVRMIDCVGQLHAAGVLHRDIKPQNFLIGAEGIVVSDLGLCTEVASTTAFTRSSVWAGTPGYLPPEYINGGFKDSDETTDIFMLGKSFYAILSGRDPMYLVSEGLPPQLMPVIERCCATAKSSRYASLGALKQSLSAAFDVILQRAVGPGRAYATLRSITDKLQSSAHFSPDEVTRFIEELAVLEGQDKHRICLDLPPELFVVVSDPAVLPQLPSFLSAYEEMARNATYSWSFAEIIASNMRKIFESHTAPARDKVSALRTAIVAAERQNRFAAMDTCTAMIKGIIEDELGQRTHDLLLEYPFYFIENIDPSSCNAPAVRAAILRLKDAKEAAEAAARETKGDDPLPF
jgi:eukaryotic-like serine/threonine-protein kinase